ncbi:DUF882 domain-containing protein [Xanthomonas euvesicatoria pv. eucalypti]|uniref:YcbK family protein n=1 Tax=Lysobacteraceae TaxID=32033 RepID=UPI0013DAD226|nr:DUF882 domain-containing protein [Stenotrophomonas maltophilia]MDO7931571.1 DUF882 domain-containing protein [Xanthomonas euvesicatoria pv. eucalypti]MDO7935702.1 DUF882 domain-containing protein [Xanthomonas euvesicatoria pv. eucalypti]MDO7940099.1 DUF882 domain-containing protein [Xanthomonas euvesicatoria pv. eucalypti]MDO7944548.1 DUF882 domain-containing protein [Xanthomonas euvesicatoria pv. eucalypti]MDO7951951.1 DUF882 domain-containing protein [Xanthomonas euvesicatoria pv. eucalyp
MTYELISRRRRALLTSIVSGITAMGASAALSPAFARSGFVIPDGHADAYASATFWAQPRVLRLYRPSSGEAVEACYWRDGRLDTAGYLQICRLLRDVRAGKAATIDIRLLNLLRGMQGWVEMTYGIRDPYQVNSGYRTQETNNDTEGAARQSLHMKGQAVDGLHPGLPLEYTGNLFKAFQGGGVGFYLNSKKFIHADVGRVRQWRG